MKLHKLIVSFFSALANYAIGHPRRVLVIAAAVTLAAAPGLLGLKLRTDGHALISDQAPAVRYDKSIRKDFGIKDEIVVLVRSEHPDGIYNPATLQLVRDLTAEFGKLPGVKSNDVVSLATESSFRTRPGTLLRQTLLEPPLKTEKECDLLREDIGKIQLYTGTFVSYDGKSTAILLAAPPAGDRTLFYERLLAAIAAKGPLPDEIAVTGAPVAEALLGIHILEDLGVPKALLGASTRSRAEPTEWKWPASFYELRLLVARKIGLVPVAVVVMMLVFLVSFRNALATLLPLPEVASVLVFTLGLMGYCGVPIYLTIAVMPVLLTAMVVTDEIHVFSRYFALLRERPGVSHVELVRATMDEMCCPVANTTLTTAIGFVSFAFSPLGPVRAFGIFTAIGVLFSLIYSLTVIPAMLALIQPRWFVRHRQAAAAPGASATAPWFGRFALAVVRSRHWVIGLVLLGTALTPLGLRRLAVQDSWIDGFDPDSDFRRATELVNSQFHGMHLLLISFEDRQTIKGEIPASAIGNWRLLLPTNLVQNPKELAGAKITLLCGEPQAGNAPAGAAKLAPRQFHSHIEMVGLEGSNVVARLPVRDFTTNVWAELAQAGKVGYEIGAQTHLRPETLRRIAELGEFVRVRREYTVGGVLTPADYVATSRFMVRYTDASSRYVPEDAGEIKLLWDYYRIARGQERFSQVVDGAYSRSLITVFLKDGNFIDTARLMRDIRDYERQHLAPQGIKLGFAGDVAVSQSLISGIVSTQLRSLAGSLLGIYLVTALLGRSWRWGVYCVLPSALSVLINFAVMGWFGIPLGVATSMFAGMTLGIGVDFAIHVLEGYSLARDQGLALREALSASMARTGPAVVINTVAIALGFGVLMLSQVPANAWLGILVVLGLVDCLIASLLLLPVLLHWWPLKDVRDSPRPEPAIT